VISHLPIHHYESKVLFYPIISIHHISKSNQTFAFFKIILLIIFRIDSEPEEDDENGTRIQELGTREQPVGANVVFQHSELMVK